MNGTTTRARDSFQPRANQFTRNKENRAENVSPQTRPSSLQTPGKQDFFTDSYLDLGDASDSSHSVSLLPLPTNRPQFTKARKQTRVVRQRPTDIHEQRQGLSRVSTRSPPTYEDFKHAYRNSIDNSLPSTHSPGLSTPPKSREDQQSQPATPSSPPRENAGIFERINQEAELAALEGNVSDDDHVHVFSAHPAATDADLRHHSLPFSRSANLTPTPDHRRRAMAPTQEDATTASVMSDPTNMNTGTSLLNGMHDSNLAQAMTPMLYQSTKDKEELRALWENKKLRAFSKAGPVTLQDLNLPNLPHPTPSPRPLQRVVAFSRAGRIKLESDDKPLTHQHHRTFSDVTEQVNQHEDGGRGLAKDDWLTDGIPRAALPHNPRLLEKAVPTVGAGRLRKDVRISEANERQVNGFGSMTNGFRRAKSASPLVAKSELAEAPQVVDSGTNGFENNGIQHDQNLNVDKAMPSIEPHDDRHDLTDYSQTQATSASDLSPQKSRRFDVDFTGQSFEVSQSPPVRSKASPYNVPATQYDHSRRMSEIRELSQQAVTTSRLSQLKARNFQLMSRRASQPVDAQLEAQSPQAESTQQVETDTDTSINTSRSKQRSSSPNSSRSTQDTVVRATPSRTSSHDALQRLARGSSSTPRSVTPSNKHKDVGGTQPDSKNDRVLVEQPKTNGVRKSELDEQALNIDLLPQATPRVSGAYTDTILPETARTLRQTSTTSKYTQTPAVKPGGWVDTPTPDTIRAQKLDAITEDTEEIHAQLTVGIADGRAGSNTMVQTIPEIPAAVISDENRAALVVPDASKSIAKKVIEQAKQKGEREGDLGPSVEDTLTLNLGNATIMSLENLLDMDETDVTTLSRIGIGNTDAMTENEILDKMTSRIKHLAATINQAKQGINRIEGQMTQPSEMIGLDRLEENQEDKISVDETDVGLRTKEVQTPIAGQKSVLLPWIPVNVTFPLPLLWQSNSASTPRGYGYFSYVGRITPLGLGILGLLTWYILEVFMGEIYGRPYAAAYYTWPSQPEPEFPLVLPTMLMRWTGLDGLYDYTLGPILNIFMIFWRLLMDVFGHELAGPSGTGVPREVITAATTVVRKVASTTAQAMGYDDFTTEDEYL